ncbi:N-acetylmuramoyl-L-alanine amidase, partial [Aerococcaceae bacterium NML191219]|nr:N-acetylmuramoyl-L-alanine amidase [Aerococcaceae bacterium NML191219]
SWGGHQAQNKWSYSPSVSTWYYSDVSGWITRKASRTSYEHNGTQQGDVLVSINNAQVYYEPQSWGGHQAQNKWSYSPSVSTWYYSDVSGWITRKASRTSYEHNGTQQGDVLVSINNAQVYYEPQSWGGHQARNKWSYSPSVSTWYYSDANGQVKQTIQDVGGINVPYDVKIKGVSDLLYLGETFSKAKKDKAQKVFGQRFSVSKTLQVNDDILLELSDKGKVIGYISSRAVVKVPTEKRTIYLDSGHGGSELGAFKFGVAEKDLNLAITVPLAKRLREQGYIVYESRTTDKEIPLRERHIEPNKLMPDIFVSIHHNAMPESYGGRAKGILSLYHDRSVDEPGYMTLPYHPESKITEGKRLAVTIQTALERETGAPTQGTRAQNLHVTRNTDVPAALIELGFMDNWEEHQRLIDKEYQNKLISGLVKGINEFFKHMP